MRGFPRVSAALRHIGLGSIVQGRKHGRMNYKDTKPYMSAFLSVDRLTDFATFCLTDFIDWRYIHSWLVFSTQLVNCCPHKMKELYLYSTVQVQVKKDRIKEATLRFGRRNQMSSSNILSIHGLKKKHQFQDSNRDINGKIVYM